MFCFVLFWFVFFFFNWIWAFAYILDSLVWSNFLDHVRFVTGLSAVPVRTKRTSYNHGKLLSNKAEGNLRLDLSGWVWDLMWKEKWGTWSARVLLADEHDISRDKWLSNKFSHSRSGISLKCNPPLTLLYLLWILLIRPGFWCVLAAKLFKGNCVGQWKIKKITRSKTLLKRTVI